MNNVRNVFLAVFILTAFCSCNHKSSELEQNGLNGNIKSIREISYQAFGNGDTVVKGEIIMGADINNYYAEYNIQGNQTSIINYDNLGEMTDKWIFRYNSQKEAIGGNYYFKDNSLLDSTYYVKDNKGNILEFYHLFPDGRLRYKIDYTYNRKNKVIEKKVFDHENLLYSVTKYIYKHGNLIADSNYGRNNELQYFSIYSYDKNDRLILQQIHNADSSVNTTGTYGYNENDDIIYQTTEVPNEPKMTYRHTYKYDNHNNWIERITYINDSAAYITVRQIEYYK
ncbi:MAG: hypothetical protein IJ681_00960 [Bacteroidales bacterium]|nr:hypothetical protein [Bacteroidales bacterium]